MKPHLEELESRLTPTAHFLPGPIPSSVLVIAPAGDLVALGYGPAGGVDITLAGRNGLGRTATFGPVSEVLVAGRWGRILDGIAAPVLEAGPGALRALNPAARTILESTNAHRLQSGLWALVVEPHLEADALAYVGLMARLDLQLIGEGQHTEGGHDYIWRANQVGYPWTALGENTAWERGYPGVPARVLADAWWASPPHRDNILDPLFTEVGVAVASAASGAVYGDVVFGGR